MKQSDKERLWNLLIKQGRAPNGVTTLRLRTIRPAMDRWDFFWTDLESHLGGMSIEEFDLARLDTQTRTHLIGNFWAMVREQMVLTKLIREGRP